MKTETKEVLEHFVEKAKKLEEYSPDKIQIRFTSFPNEENQSLEVIGQDQQKIDAFLLTFRMFIQSGDMISLNNLNNNIVNDPDISPKWRDEFKILYEEYHSYLKSYPSVKVLPQGDFFPTRGEIMKTVLYGNLGHLKLKSIQRKRFKEWMKLPFNPGYVDFEFLQILKKLSNIIKQIAFLTQNEFNK